MGNNKFSYRILFLIIPVLLLFLFLAYKEVNAQNEFSTDILERLKQQEIPVKRVTVISRLPYEIEIALQSSSNDEHLSMDDNWFMQIARREATFAYRISTRLSSYKLNVYNIMGELIYSSQAYLYPDDLNQQKSVVQSKVGVQETKDIVIDQLQFSGLTLNTLEVKQDFGSDGQVLIIVVSVDDLDSANKSLPTFLGSFLRLLDVVNVDYGTGIVLCHLRVLDSKGNILLDYVKDVESGSTQWTSAEGLYSEWFPHPAGPKIIATEPEEGSSQEPYPIPTMIENLDFSYPAPVQTAYP